MLATKTILLKFIPLKIQKKKNKFVVDKDLPSFIFYYIGVSTLWSFTGDKNDHKLHFDHELHMMSHPLIIWDYECLELCSIGLQHIKWTWYVAPI